MNSLDVIATLIFTLVCSVCSKEVKREEQTTVVSSTQNALVVSTSTTTRRPFLPGARAPCSCLRGDCGCCTGILLERLRQKICANVTFVPEELAFHARLIANGRVLYENTLSGRNPPPVCARIPRIRFITVCLKFSNVYFAQRNIHICMGLEANWEDFTLFDFSFDCIRFGANGLATVNPVEGGGLPGNPLDSEEQTDEDYDDNARNEPFPIDISESSCYVVNNKFIIKRLPSSNEFQINLYRP